MEDIAFSEWSERMDIAGTNHWLPAYGFQQPTQLHHDRDTDDGGTVLIAGQQQQFLFLETIVEETSDDLRSESDRSGPAGWPDSDSDTASVIHVPNSLDCCDAPEWSGSERDLAVPKKRRRRTDDDQELESASLSSRSSSLIQFECLERHCEDVFRASASADPFPPPSPSVASNFSFDSLESQRWRFSASPDSLDSSSDDASSDDTLQHSSWSSRGSFRSSSGRLRSFRSVDSLNLVPRTPAAEPARPAPQAPATSKSQRSAENLSEDSGFGDHCVTSSSARGSTVGTIVEDEDSCSSYYSDSSAGSSSETSEHEALKLKRGWGDEEAKFNSSCWQSAPSLLQAEEKKKRRGGRGLLAVQAGSQQLSSVPDNLCLCAEDDDVGDAPNLRHSSMTRVLHESEEPTSKRLVSGNPFLSGDDSLSMAARSTPNLEDHSSMSRVALKSEEPMSKNLMSGNVLFSSGDDTFGMAARSTPNLEDHLSYSTAAVPVKSKEVTSKSVASGKPVNQWVYASDGTVNVSRRSTPNLEDLLRHSSMTSVPLKSEEPAVLPSPGKGVHFCPVVAEVSWRDSYSYSYSDGDSDGEEPKEEMERALYALERGEDVTFPSKPSLTLQKIQVGVPAGPGSAERERVVVDLQQEVTRGHVVSAASDGSAGALAVCTESMETKQQQQRDGKKTAGRFGSFFQRFSLRRLSGNASSKKKDDKKKATASPAAGKSDAAAEYEDVTIIPLHPPSPSTPPPPPPVSSKPPPSPRRRPCPIPDAQNSSDAGVERQRADMARIDPPPGLLETDLDTHVSTVRPVQNGAAPSSKKARSLLNLGDIQQQQQQQHVSAMLLKPPPGGGGATNRPITPADSRAKSMEFLLDKENQAAVQPPENELQKGGAGERVMSEHQLRVQRSLQKLNVPDWYKNANVARGAEGFLLKRSSEHGWPGLGSKTTSLSSLGSTQSAAARSPTSHLLSPSPTPHVFTRWSTSRLNSGGTSASTSPCGSTRSSFNYRQPYLGWRSSERLSRPRTPAERLAAGMLPTQQQQQQQQQQQPMISPPGITNQHTQQDIQQMLQQEAELEQLRREDEEQMQQVPNLSEVRTSIKEVTSAIVHYVSGVQEGGGDSRWDSLSPPRGTSTTPRGSPRGSSGRLCWLESSFVGSRPLDSPETPLTLTSADVNKTLETLQQQQQQQQQLQQQQQDGGLNVKRTTGPSELYLDLNSSHHHQVNAKRYLF